MQKDKSLYSRLVDLKKRYIKTQLVPGSIAPLIDGLFNALHNALIQTKDISRDALIRAKDHARDALQRSRDISRDAIVKSKDLARDSLIRSKDLTHDSLIRSKDLTRDALIQSKDRTRDTLRTSIQMIEESSANSYSAARMRSFIVFPFILVKHIILSVYDSMRLMPYAITESSDQEAVSHIGTIVANSLNVKGRVQRYYGRGSVVINPPIDTLRLRYSKDTGYWLSVNRITPEKRIEMQLEAFSKLPDERLFIIGGHDENHKHYQEELDTKATYNVQFIGTVNDEELLEFYSKCRGFITTSLDEDFGMTAVEALASGKPVIAPNEGGYKESVIDGETGTLIDDISADRLREAIQATSDKLASDPEAYKDACQRRAQEFSTEKFAAKIRSIIGV